MSRSLALVALLLPCFASAPAQDLTLDQVIQKNTEAVGGADAVKAIQTLQISGKMVMGGGQLQMPLTIRLKRPGLSRLDAELQGRPMIRGFDGTTAWQIMPMGNAEPQKMGEKETQDASETDVDAQVGLLAASRAKAQSMELVGKEETEGSQTYKIKVTRKSGGVVYVWLDAATFLPIKSNTKVNQMGMEIEVDSYSKDYRKVGGVVMSHSNEQKVGGRSMVQLVFDKVEVNQAIDDSIFKMPAPAPKPEEKKPEEKKN